MTGRDRGGVLALAAVTVLVPSLALGSVGWQNAAELLLWATTALSTATAFAWVVLTYVVGAGYEAPDPIYKSKEVQVRAPRVDTGVVQATVDSLPDTPDDVHVVPKPDIGVPGAAVRTVPSGFEYDAVRKGWAIG
jgi:hypothetical protein